MKIKFLKDDALEELKQNIKSNINQYQKTKSDWINEEYFGVYDKDFPDFKLDMSDKKPDKTDFKNIKILYSNLKELKDSQAADERVWAGLCHKEFWDYMQYRWCSKEGEVIEQHYFFGENHPKMLNGLARLWWTGRLTYDETAKDPFELTEYLCKDLNGRGTALFAVAFPSNKRLTRVFLRTLMEFEKKRELSREEFNDVKKIMVLWGGSLVLDSLSDEELSNKIKLYLKNNIKKVKK